MNHKKELLWSLWVGIIGFRGIRGTCKCHYLNHTVTRSPKLHFASRSPAIKARASRL